MDQETKVAIENDDLFCQFSHRGETWNRIEFPSIDWEAGPEHRSPMVAAFHSSRGPTHFHTDIEIQGRIIHVDFIAAFSSGLAMGVCEYRFYDKESLVSRGGYQTRMYSGSKFGQPAAVQTGNRILVAHRNLQYESVPIRNAMSLWQRATPPTP
ncbi:hypothetical protein [Crateriforma conspicua]|uniref:hypothetical protein n=1 Tax=Crateriforma conspicua TaxID=2527996 RepID=UPI0011B5AB62|nr:hypothetical protein [Crateriforma conspicua]